MKVLSIQVGRPKTHGEAGAAEINDRPWTTGFFKMPLASRVFGLFTDFGSGVENHYSLLCYPSGGAGAAMSPRVAVF